MSNTKADSSLNELVARNFGKAAAEYEKKAKVQKEVARRLIASLHPWRDILPQGPILEIGAGTGFVTEGLLDLYPEREVVVTDLSEEMVAFSRKKLGDRPNVSFRQLDAELLDVDEPIYAMTVCGFAAQWFDHPALTLGKCLEATQPGGLLLASFPGEESFPEWKEQCRELGLPYTGNTFPDMEEMVVKLSVGPVQLDYYEDTVKQSFSDAKVFFRHIKQIGAATKKDGRHLKPAELKLLIDYWNESAGGEIEVSYHVVFLAVKRDLDS